MYTLTASLYRYRFLLGFVAAMAFAIALAPTVFAGARDLNDYTGCDHESDPFCLTEFASSTVMGDASLQATIARLINVSLSLLGVVAVVIILIGGFKWMTAGGSEDKTLEARKLIFQGIIGLAIILSSWAITRFVFGALTEATGSGSLPENF